MEKKRPLKDNQVHARVRSVCTSLDLRRFVDLNDFPPVPPFPLPAPAPPH